MKQKILNMIFLESYVPYKEKKTMTIEQMQKRFYELYQLDWLAKNGFSVLDVAKEICENVTERISMELVNDNSEYDLGRSSLIGGRQYPRDTDDIYQEEMQDWLSSGVLYHYEETGVSKMIWKSFSEFMECEYTQKGYIIRLASVDPKREELLILYLEDKNSTKSLKKGR